MSQRPTDPVLRSSRREAWVVLIVSLAALVYTIVYCSLHGYGRPPESVTFVLGFPDWVFWGVLVPWGACLLFSSVFALYFMRDEDLGDAPADPAEAAHE